MRVQPQVREWMSPDPITVPKSYPIMEAHELMRERKVRRLLVMDEGQLVGILTLGDVRGAEPSEVTSLSIFELNYLLSRLTVDRVMSHPVITVSQDTTVDLAAKMMLENQIAGLPVMDGGQLVGIITESDIFRMVVRLWEKESLAEPVM